MFQTSSVISCISVKDGKIDLKLLAQSLCPEEQIREVRMPLSSCVLSSFVSYSLSFKEKFDPVKVNIILLPTCKLPLYKIHNS